MDPTNQIVDSENFQQYDTFVNHNSQANNDDLVVPYAGVISSDRPNMNSPQTSAALQLPLGDPAVSYSTSNLSQQTVQTPVTNSQNRNTLVFHPTVFYYQPQNDFYHYNV